MSDEKKTEAALPGPNAEVEKDPTAAAADHGATTGDNLPAAPGTTPEPVVVGERRGMFGAIDAGDTSGYGGLRSPILFPAAAQRPYGAWFDEAADQLGTALTTGDGPGYHKAIERVVVDRGEMTLFVAREHLLAVARALRDDPGLRFEMCTGVSGVHYPGETGRELHAQIQGSKLGVNRIAAARAAEAAALAATPTSLMAPTHDHLAHLAAPSGKNLLA